NSAIAAKITPYPTPDDIDKRAAGAWSASGLSGDRARWPVKLLQKLPFQQQPDLFTDSEFDVQVSK
ncbi:MAG: hypothetical protein OEN22_04595, partial [Gammaproteobacteria bacterium]|nr:hypothetical protein [Gammaproteobacteria bacterium]